MSVAGKPGMRLRPFCLSRKNNNKAVFPQLKINKNPVYSIKPGVNVDRGMLVGQLVLCELL